MASNQSPVAVVLPIDISIRTNIQWDSLSKHTFESEFVCVKCDQTPKLKSSNNAKFPGRDICVGNLF